MATSEPFCLHWIVWAALSWLLFPAISLVANFPHDLLPHRPRSQPRQLRRSRTRRVKDDQNNGDDQAASASSSAALPEIDYIAISSLPTGSANTAYREAIAWQSFQLFLVWLQYSCCKKLAACHPGTPDSNLYLTVGLMLLNAGFVLYSLWAFLIWPRSTSG